jgi:hypothetical protein
MTHEDKTTPEDLVLSVRSQFLQKPEHTSHTLEIAIRESTDIYLERLRTLKPDEAIKLGNYLTDSNTITKLILNHIEQLGDLSEVGKGDKVKEYALYGVAAQIASALRLSPETVENEAVQLIISDAFGVVNDIADVSSSDFYLGRNPVDKGIANRFVEGYFAAVPFSPSVYEMLTAVNPVDLVLQDWGAAVRYCRAMGVQEDAFLRDGTNLFRFAPDALPYVYEHREDFPGLELTKVNDGAHVDSWLTHAKIGVNERNVTLNDWLILLTGYISEDNAAIPGLNERYNAPLVATALDVQNRRF